MKINIICTSYHKPQIEKMLEVVKITADEFNKEFLGEIPISPEIGKLGDSGIPIVESKPDHEITKIYLGLAEKVKSTYL